MSTAGGRPGRNDPCACGSGRKFKHCCGKVAPAPASAPQDAGALQLGIRLLNGGRPQEALPVLERAAALQPRSAQVHFLRGRALEALGWHTEAAQAYEQAIGLAPAYAEAHAQLGVVRMVQERRPEAAASFRRAAGLAPRTRLGRLSGAYALLAENRAAEAQAALRRLTEIEPGNAPAHAELGKLLSEAGEADAARAAFLRAVELDPGRAGHYYDLVRIRRLTESDRPLLARMLEVSQRPGLPDIHRILLELALGKAYDDLGDAERAMRHYLAGNAMKSRIRPLDRGMIEQRVDWAMRVFTREFFENRAAAGSPDGTPILVLGMPRSGTTLVESILASHSRVAAGQELSYWGRCARPMAEAGETPAAQALHDMAAGYLATLRQVSPAPHVTDKKPDNFFWIGLIHAAFPHARFVHCRRDALDTCVSVLANFFAPRPDFSTEPGDLAFYYRQYERVMAHWRAVLPAGRLLELDYESLVTEPEPSIRHLVEFCGLPWEDACLYPERSTRRINTASLWQAREPIFRGSIGRWRRFQPWLGELASLAR